MLSVLGAVFIAAAVAALFLGTDRLLWVVAAAVPFTATAGVTLAGQSLVMYPFIAIVLVAICASRAGVGRLLRENLSTRRALGLLVALGLWSIVVTVLGPLLFAGTPVLDPKRGIDTGVGDPQPLAFALSNVAQLGYLLIGIATVIAIGTTRRLSPHLPAVAFGVGTVVSSGRYLLPEALQTTLFDNSNNVAYTTGQFNGDVERLRGIFSEPSSFGAFSAAGAVFFFVAAGRLGGRTRLLYLGLGVWSFVNAVYSFSGGALITGLIVLALLAAKGVATLVLSRSRINPAALLSILLIPVLWLLVGHNVLAFVQQVISNKTDSSSFANRTAANDFSYDLMPQTFGLGVGLGSNRPSSFVASVVSTIGLPGLVLFGFVFVALTVAAVRTEEFSAAAWALVTIIVSKVVAGPDISDPPMWFLLGVCAYATWAGSSRGDRGRGDVDRSKVVVLPQPGKRSVLT